MCMFKRLLFVYFLYVLCIIIYVYVSFNHQYWVRYNTTKTVSM